MGKNKNSSARCIIVLFVIAVVCVFALCILNDVLYVPPDMSVFTKAAEGNYTETEIKSVPITSGKVIVAVNGTTAKGENVVGMYVTGNKFGKADSFSIAVVVDTATDKIVGTYLIADGSTGGYDYDDAKLQCIVGTSITSEDYTVKDGLVQTGTTNSSNAVKNAVMTAAEYYKGIKG